MMGLKKKFDKRRQSGCTKRMSRQVVIQTGRNVVDGENLPGDLSD